MTAKLTIILTSHDKFELLQFAVASVFEQTYQDWELYIADDASKDERIAEYLKRLEMTDGRVHVFFGKPITDTYRKLHKVNAIRINAVLNMSEGEYISYLGDDNVYLPDRCERMVRCLDVDKNIEMVVDRVRWIMFDGKEADQDSYKYGYKEPFEKGHNRLLKMIAPSNYICNDSIMHHRPKRQCCMNWPTDVQSATPVDWRYWCYLVDEMKYRVKRLDVVGERAYFPGTWRHGVTVKQVLPSRRDLPINNRRKPMSKVRLKKRRRKEERQESKRKKAMDPTGKIWCVNTSGKVQQVPQNNGAALRIEPGARIEDNVVAIWDSEGKQTGIFPGFSYDSRVVAPPLKEVLSAVPTPPAKVEYTVDEKPEPKAKPVKLKSKPGSVLDKRKRQVTSRRPVEKRPTDAPPSEADTKSRLCSGCGKPIYAGNKSGKCRACYNASRKRKE